MALYPYLFFSGTCRAAFTRYEEIFGGDLELMTMADLPSEEAVPADQAGLIMHAALTFDGHLLMASDDPTGGGGPMRGVSVNYTVADASDVRRVFEALAEVGEITMPLAEMVWSTPAPPVPSSPPRQDFGTR